MLLIYMSFIDDESHRRLFEEIYLSYRKQMFLVARTVLKNDSDAEDIVHDVFLRVAKKYMAKISTIENETDLRNYLLKATKNAALDHLRKHRHERVRTEEENETDVPREASEMFHSTNSAQNPAFCGLWVHSLKTSDKVLKYGENNRVDFSEHPTVVKRGSVRTINIYAAVPDVA